MGLAVLTTKKIKHYNANRENIRVIARGVDKQREREREREGEKEREKERREWDADLSVCVNSPAQDHLKKKKRINLADTRRHREDQRALA